MRVLYDSQAFDLQQVGGVSRYFAELIGALRSRKLVSARPSFFFTENLHLQEKRIFGVWSIPKRYEWKYKTYYKHRLNRLTTELALALNLGDLLHMTFYDIALLEQARCPFVVTVYDMIPQILPQFFADPASIHPNKLELCQKANAAICISENTKKDLVRLYQLDPAKVFVTHLGINPNWATNRQEVPGLPGSFLLYVGMRRAYKNFKLAALSLSRLSSHYPDLHLVCVGGGGFTQEEMELLRSLSLCDRAHQLTLRDAQLAYCYSKAVAFIFPSLYEGFGLPILESFLCGCPAVLADRSCFPEVADDAAEYFDPDSVDSLNCALEAILRDHGHRSKLIERGFNRVRDYTWIDTAKRTVDVYRNVV